jgi:hypothetical protein
LELHRPISILICYVKVEAKDRKTMHYAMLTIPYTKRFKELLGLSTYIYFTADETATYLTTVEELVVYSEQ